MGIFEKKIMGMPFAYFIVTICLFAVGIIVGSFCDLQISQTLANKTDIGAFFATYGSYVSYCFYPAAGMCLFKGLKKKDEKYNLLAWILLVISYFLAVYYSNSYNGSKVRELFGYKAGTTSIWLTVLSYLFWVVLYSWVPVVFYFALDDADPNKLLAVGLTILVAGVVSDNVNLWLKQVGSRPRYKYLISDKGSLDEFRNWWEWVPNKAGSDDNFKSWPSGNMTIAAMVFSLPMLLSLLKKKNALVIKVSYFVALAFVLLYAYNRIHMTNHFLTDVCFGALITYLIHCGINVGFNKLVI